jgi:hypothetical protein
LGNIVRITFAFHAFASTAPRSHPLKLHNIPDPDNIKDTTLHWNISGTTTTLTALTYIPAI